MGSSYFYMEFLMAWLTRLKQQGYRNPACFALEYTLVPDAKSPTQLNETRAGYQFLLDNFGATAASKICVSGDSAGATLIMSMLLHDGTSESTKSEKPALAVLLSPWTHLVSELNRNTSSDYLDKNSLELYAKQYAEREARTNEILSPGLCVDKWKQAEPTDGFRMIYGAEEVFGPAIQQTVAHMKKNGVLVKTHAHEAGIHAWPVVDLFLGETREGRLTGLNIMTDFVLSSSLGSALRK
jgi:acetyl esterase/lipase